MTDTIPAGERPVCPRLGAQFDPFVAHTRDPYPFYARARLEEPVFYSPRLDMWRVTRSATRSHCPSWRLPT